METSTTEEWARCLLQAFDTATSLEPLTDSLSELTSSEAYAIAEEIRRLRGARGETVIGWKIGFTNRTIWDDYGVHAPIWGPMYASTSDALATGEWAISKLREPKIEAEIAFRFSSTPHPGSDEAGLLESIDAVSHAFEFVQSPFPGWRFAPVDTMAAAGLHGSFAHGVWHAVGDENRSDWLTALSDFSITIRSDTGVVDVGRGENVLGGPLSALRHFVDESAEVTPDCAIAAGDVVTTGTVPKAYPVKPGETWTTEVDGLPVDGLSVHCV